MIQEAMKMMPDNDYALEMANILRRRVLQARMMPFKVCMQ